MKKAMIITSLLMGTTLGYSQTTTTYYDQNGMPIGKAKTEQTQTQQPYQASAFNYQSSLPSLDLIERGMAYKQGQTDNRRVVIQSMIDGIGADINRLFSAYPDEYKQLFKGLADLIASLNNVQQDITQDMVYNQIVERINDFKSKVYGAYKRVNATITPTSSTGLSDLLEYKIGNPPTFLSMSQTRVEGLLHNRSIHYDSYVAEDKSELDGYRCSNGIYVSYTFNNATCNGYFLETSPSFKENIATLLNRLYIPKVDDGKSENVDGIWLDQTNGVKWTMKITADKVIVQAIRNSQ